MMRCLHSSLATLTMVGLLGLPPAALRAQERVATGRDFMISAPTPEGVRAGLEIRDRGGNAVDAAAAVAFAVVVTDPQMGSIGGRSQILIRRADGSVHGIDGATLSPLGVDEPWRQGQGYGVIPIPGTPAALEEMLHEHGTMTLAQVLEPAIRLASEGFVIKRDLHSAFRTHRESLARYPGSRAHFLKADGSPYSEGETFRQPALARTLETLAREGAQALYTGSLARVMAREMETNGGPIRMSDLALYQPRPGEIVEGSYRGHEIVARGGNCDGASVIEVLQILEHFDLAGYQITDPEYIHILAQALYIGTTDEHVPDWMQVSPEHAARRRMEIDLDRALPMAIRDQDQEGDTHHLSVLDAAGNAVSITQSIGPSFGSKVASEEMGFFYAYSYDMNDDPVPFQREKTSQSPTMLLKNGAPFLVLGSAGSGRIPGSIVRTAVNVIDHGMPLAQALGARRWFLYQGELRMEDMGLPEGTKDALGALGYDLSLYSGQNGFLARVHAIFRDPETGLMTGAGDPRDYGGAGGR